MKRVIILEKHPGPRVAFKYALWADVPTARQSFYADVNKKSAFKQVTLAEEQQLQTGAVAERVDSVSFAPGTPITEIQGALLDAWQKFQDEVNVENPWDRYGTFWDGATWTSVRVS